VLVEHAGSTMSSVLIEIQRVSDLMRDISAAAREQHLGIEQIDQAIAQLDDTTQQNAALVEQATAAAQALQEQAAGLTRTVSAFTLGQPAATPATTRPRQALSRRALLAA
jgi:methyl-accepting chemotaxis protein-1 (serine sensor receptor)